ncbi:MULTISPECIES: lectin like domain-containing protein [Listeria]|uniref:lectin like domain-containing protein n=1 Tax=Listeria TaxID=1637 RepID=UPI001356576C|nr:MULTISPECIES: lectin like domain-containing protein [Listeria]
MKKFLRLLAGISFIFASLFLLLPGNQVDAREYPTGSLKDPIGVYEQPKPKQLLRSTPLPTKYDPRLTGGDTSVKDQQTRNICWSFSSNASIETAALKQFGVPYDLSELYTDYYSAKDADGIIGNNPKAYNRTLGGGGLETMALYEAMNWELPVSENKMPYNTNASYLPSLNVLSEKPLIHQQGINLIGGLYVTASVEEQNQKVKRIKEHLVKNGGLTYQWKADGQYLQEYINSTTSAVYVPKSDYTTIDHSTLIVGYDDNYSKENFKSNVRPQNNGAFIVRNSWGTNWGDKGYYYVSYEDAYILTSVMYGAKQMETSQNYDNMVAMAEFALTGWYPSTTDTYIANVFDAPNDSKESIEAIAINTLQYDTPYEIYINPNSSDKSFTNLKLVARGVKADAGFETIKLSEPVPITSNDKYAVVIKFSLPSGVSTLPIPMSNHEEVSYPRNSVKSGTSFFSISTNQASMRWYEASSPIIWDDKIARNFYTNVYTTTNNTQEKIKDVFLDADLANEIARQLNKSVEDNFTTEDAGKITQLRVDGKVSNATGIERLNNLTHLIFYGGTEKLEKIDLSKNLNLIYLDLGNNNFSTLDLRQNKKLVRINMYKNQLTNLDLSQNTALDYLELSYNKLQQLDVSKNTNLTYIVAGGNQLSNLDVSKNTKLSNLWIHNNKLTTINVSNNTELRGISMGGNPVYSLTLPYLPKLDFLDVQRTPSLSSLDLSRLPNLRTLHLNNANLSSINLSQNLKLKFLYLEYNKLTKIDLRNNVELYELYLHRNLLTELDLSKNVKLNRYFYDSDTVTNFIAPQK